MELNQYTHGVVIPDDPKAYTLDPYLPDILDYHDVHEIIHFLTVGVKRKILNETFFINPLGNYNVRKLNILLEHLFDLFEEGISDIDSMFSYIVNQDIETLFQALKYIWCRLPNECVIGWENYLKFRSEEQSSLLPNTAFDDILLRFMDSYEHTLIVKDFFNLIEELSLNLHISIEHIVYVFTLWAFDVRDSNQNADVDITSDARSTIKVHIRRYDRKADGLYHLFLAYVRNKKDSKISFQLSPASYPPKKIFGSNKIYKTCIPLVSVRSNTVLSPIKLLQECNDLLDFSNFEIFEAFEDYVILKSIFLEHQTDVEVIKTMLNDFSLSVFNFLVKDASVWTSNIKIKLLDELSKKIIVERLHINEFLLSTWVNSIAFEQTNSKKEYFGKFMILEFELHGFTKMVGFQEYKFKEEEMHSTSESFEVSVTEDESSNFESSSLSKSDFESPFFSQEYIEDKETEIPKAHLPLSTFANYFHSKSSGLSSHHDLLSATTSNPNIKSRLFPSIKKLLNDNNGSSNESFPSNNSFDRLSPPVIIRPKSPIRERVPSPIGNQLKKFISNPKIISSSNQNIDVHSTNFKSNAISDTAIHETSNYHDTKKYQSKDTDSQNDILIGLTPHFKRLTLTPSSEIYTPTSEEMDISDLNVESTQNLPKVPAIISTQSVSDQLIETENKIRLTDEEDSNSEMLPSLEEIKEKKPIPKVIGSFPESPIIKCNITTPLLNDSIQSDVSSTVLKTPSPKRIHRAEQENLPHTINTRSPPIHRTRKTSSRQKRISSDLSKLPIQFPNYNSQRVSLVYSSHHSISERILKTTISGPLTSVTRKRPHKSTSPLMKRPSVRSLSDITTTTPTKNSSLTSSFSKNNPRKREESRKKFESEIRHSSIYQNDF